VTPYEATRERLERASEMLREIRAVKAALKNVQICAEAEWASATRDLRQYETSPGIPLPQYREQVQA
jgi:hypothetical protein